MVARALFAVVLAAAPDAGTVAAPPGFQWDVPGQVSHIDVAGIQVALGVPMKLHAVISNREPKEILDHFQKEFIKANFYVPGPRHQGHIDGRPHLTALDPSRMLAYTVMCKRLGDRKTMVMLGTSNLAQARKMSEQAFAPVPPGARDLAVIDVEASQSMGFAVNLPAEEIHAFYTRELTKKGYVEKTPGVFRKDAHELRVRVRPPQYGARTVTITGRTGAEEEEL